jgi:hypothetical protein
MEFELKLGNVTRDHLIRRSSSLLSPISLVPFSLVLSLFLLDCLNSLDVSKRSIYINSYLLPSLLT